MPNNFYSCLHVQGFKDGANSLYRSTVNLIEKSGFREHDNPFTSEGHGAEEFYVVWPHG